MTEFNLEEQLQEAFTREVNSRISLKARERMSTSQYLARRNEEENQVIESGFLFSIFENATLEEVEALNPTFLREKVLLLIVIQALRTYVDNNDESNPKCQALHELYLQLKKELSAEIPFESGDGFADYLASKTERTELENARQTGSVCLKCGSHNVRSKGQEWICENGHRFRKH